MSPFTYARPTALNEALQLAGPHTRFIAGGTNLIDLMKENVERPQRLIDITGLPLHEVSDTVDGGLLIGALVSNSDLAWHARVEHDYPLLAQAILAGASPQLRNMATTGGNLLQRTRCQYFYDTAAPCNKRQPGSGCSALKGLNRNHAILGASEHCVATHPSDMCVAMAALQAVVHIASPQGTRRVAFADFHQLPGDTPERDNVLADDELITAIELPAAGFAQHCHYLKIRDRESYAFALVSVAAALEIDGHVIGEARIALGGVAHKPWRVSDAEAVLVGKPPTPANFRLAADLLVDGAVGLGRNNFKVELARRAVVRALSDAATAGVSA